MADQETRTVDRRARGPWLGPLIALALAVPLVAVATWPSGATQEVAAAAPPPLPVQPPSTPFDPGVAIADHDGSVVVQAEAAGIDQPDECRPAEKRGRHGKRADKQHRVVGRIESRVECAERER